MQIDPIKSFLTRKSNLFSKSVNSNYELGKPENKLYESTIASSEVSGMARSKFLIVSLNANQTNCEPSSNYVFTSYVVVTKRKALLQLVHCAFSL